MQRTRTAFVTVVSFGILSMNAQVFSDGDPEGLLFSGHTGGFLGQGVSCVDFNNDGLDSVVVQWPWGLSTTHLGLEVDGRHIVADLGADNGSEGMGCTYTAACNFDPTAIEDDGSCDLSCICGGGLVWDEDTQTCVIQCVGDLNFDQSVSTTDLLYFLSVYGLECG